jgi:hypothetical protein
MAPKLNSDVSEALRSRAYVIVPKEEYRQLVEHEFRQWLQVGADQADRGETIAWNTQEIIAEAHRRYLPESPS